MRQPVTLPAPYGDLAFSDSWYARALGLIPCTTQTLAKGPSQFVQGLAPKYLQRGAGCLVWDVDGNEYLDFGMAVGPLVLGYGHPAVDEAIRAQLADGITFTLMHPLEVQVAELVREVVPGAERVRFAKSGAEVTSAAVRLARAFTGRSRVLCCGYHGWHDWYVAVTERAAGVPGAVQDLTSTFAYNDLGSLADALDDEVACVILEPMTFEEPRPDFLPELRRMCTERGALLVFDEMWTGFRLAVGGAQERFGVTADLACFSKAVANGMPLSLLTGRADVMSLLENEVFFFSTFGGETLSLAAARATIETLRAEDVPAHLERVGGELRDGINDIARGRGLDFVRCIGPGARSLVVFDSAVGDPLLMKSLVQQELLAHGILWPGTHTLSLAHTERDVDWTLGAYEHAFAVLSEAVALQDLARRLRGAPVAAAFRRPLGFHSKPRRPRPLPFTPAR
jgi:glutamate-1-semialdehyde 2,1-aminomutase